MTAHLEALKIDTESTVKHVDEYGFITTKLKNSILSPKEKKLYQKKETEWLDIIDNWSKKSKSNSIKKMCRGGIPDSLRCKVWPLLIGADKRMKPGVYMDLVSRTQHPPIFDVIERDITRCYPEHVLFEKPGQGQSDLRRVLRAYALYNPIVGYCQGMGMLVGLLLMRMPAEETFWMLVTLLETHLNGYHSETLYQLRIDAIAFERCLKLHYRSASKLLKDLSPLTYMTQWFLTCYTMSLPWNVVLRFWDMFLWDALFRAAMFIIGSRKDYLKKNCPTSGDILQYLLGAPKEFGDADKFINGCTKIMLSHYELNRFRIAAKSMVDDQEKKQLT